LESTYVGTWPLVVLSRSMSSELLRRAEKWAHKLAFKISSFSPNYASLGRFLTLIVKSSISIV